ncbi:uncharacterized protein At5g01610 [Lactuca sativa]|uniref:DUF538 domain-containing protein n=1 Tax=Lactuca sativa TaxID=4236 RepID=A0A9R1XM53_LACSA|nr:uncharacterized protein At5g01610 [Lactuca sativa]XP_023731305.1 uncharacterized protein At5g01610 [Lactuca sativa]KAJ0218256.1 hypothetical protein LSAT_V11C300122610 [Lactuca sativa]
MEKALVKVGSIKAKAGSYWIAKKAKQELSNISDDLTTLSTTVEEKAKWIFNKLKGKPEKSLPELLREFNLPPGLFPDNIVSYEFDETKGKLVVHLPSACEVSFKDSSVIRYATRVKAILLRGKLSNIEGMKTKVLVWVKITNIAVEGYRSDKVWFTAGVKRSKPKDAYEIPSVAIRCQEF